MAAPLKHNGYRSVVQAMQCSVETTCLPIQHPLAHPKCASTPACQPQEPEHSRPPNNHPPNSHPQTHRKCPTTPARQPQVREHTRNAHPKCASTPALPSQVRKHTRPLQGAPQSYNRRATNHPQSISRSTNEDPMQADTDVAAGCSHQSAHVRAMICV